MDKYITFDYKPIVKHLGENNVKVIGYITYKIYKIYILINVSEDIWLRDNFSFCPVQAKENLSKACFVIDEVIWNKMSLSSLKCQFYRLLACIMDKEYFTITTADEFAVAHVAPKAYLRSVLDLLDFKSIIGLQFNSDEDFQYRAENIYKVKKIAKDSMKIVIEDKEYRKENK